MAQASTVSRPSGLTGLQRKFLWGSAAFVLLLPLLAMEFTREVEWSPGDFLVFGAMLAVLCLAVEYAYRVAQSRRGAALIAVLAVLVFLVTWAELAVGILD